MKDLLYTILIIGGFILALCGIRFILEFLIMIIGEIGGGIVEDIVNIFK